LVLLPILIVGQIEKWSLELKKRKAILLSVSQRPEGCSRFRKQRVDLRQDFRRDAVVFGPPLSSAGSLGPGDGFQE